MPNKLLRVLTGVAFACVTGGTALASNNKAMDADIHAIELRWEHIKFDEDGSPNQFDAHRRAGEICRRGSSPNIPAGLSP